MMRVFTNEEQKGLLFLAAILAFVVVFELFVYWAYRSRLDKNTMTKELQAPKSLHTFDPNTVEFEELVAMDIPTQFSVGLIRWREYGKVYRVVEELALVNGVTDSLYAVLKPYVVIGNEYAAKSVKEKSYSDYNHKHSAQVGEVQTSKREVLSAPIAENFVLDTVSVGYVTRWGFSPRQAEVLLNYRDAIGGIHSEEQLRRCYVVDEDMAERLLKYVIFTPKQSSVDKLDGEYGVQTAKTVDKKPLVELNSADSASLVAVDGIGVKSAHEIIKYRKLLGGYHSVGQLSELKSITESNFEKILQQIYCDSCKISKIDINFAGPKELEYHPYVSARALRRIIKQRQLKGGWTRIEEMIDDNILSEDEAKRLAPYLRFGPRATE